MDPNDFWFHWYPALFRRATRHLTTFQRGIYRELIDEYMETREPLPENDVALANIAGISAEEWADAKGVILSFFEINDGLCYHAFCNEILDHQDKLSKKRSKASKKAASSRWKHKRNQKMRDVCDSDAIAMRQNARGEERRGEESKPLTPPLKTENRFDEFWTNFPRQRRGSKDKAEQSYRKALSRAEEADIIAGTLAYAASDEVARGFAKGAAAWLNDDRWANDYGIRAQERMPNGKPDYMGGLMTAARNASRSTEGM